MPAVFFSECVAINALPGTLGCMAFQPTLVQPNGTADANGASPIIQFNGAPWYFEQGAELRLCTCMFVLSDPQTITMYIHEMGDPRNTLRTFVMKPDDGSNERV